MSTTVTFRSVTFQGIVVAAPEGELRAAVDRSGVAGLHDEDEITMGRRGLPITIDVWCKNFASDAALKAYIYGTTIKPLLNKNGTLVIAGATNRTYAETTFDSIEPLDRPTTQDHDSSLRRVQTYRCRFYCLKP